MPLGAGGHSVRWNGRVFEWFAARLARRKSCDLYHSALQVHLPEARFVVEQAPVWRQDEERGVVGEGAVGALALARLQLFRYEIRRWRDGSIPDLDEAVDSPRRLSDDPDSARRLLELVPQVPTPVWGRDELHAGEMWNSNSTISWLLARSGLDVESIELPRSGRAPGWHAGIVVARRGWAYDPLVAYDERLAERIRALLADEPALAEQRMFGGLAFLISGNMAIAASGQGGILVRVDPQESDSLVASTKAEPMEMRGRKMAGWLRVDASDVATKRQLARWVRVGAAYARSLPPKR